MGPLVTFTALYAFVWVFRIPVVQPSDRPLGHHGTFWGPQAPAGPSYAFLQVVIKNETPDCKEQICSGAT